MEKTIEQIEQEIIDLQVQKQQKEDNTLQQQLYNMFATLPKQQILMKLGSWLQQSPILKMEVKRLINDNPFVNVEKPVSQNDENVVE